MQDQFKRLLQTSDLEISLMSATDCKKRTGSIDMEIRQEMKKLCILQDNEENYEKDNK